MEEEGGTEAEAEVEVEQEGYDRQRQDRQQASETVREYAAGVIICLRRDFVLAPPPRRIAFVAAFPALCVTPATQ